LSITDVVWLLPALAGVAIAILLPSRLLALMLGPALMIVFVYTLGWSLSNHECEAGQSCTTAERVLELVNPMLLTLAPALFVAAPARYLWFWWRSRSRVGIGSYRCRFACELRFPLRLPLGFMRRLAFGFYTRALAVLPLAPRPAAAGVVASAACVLGRVDRQPVKLVKQSAPT
jgi:hypothetical protein